MTRIEAIATKRRRSTPTVAERGVGKPVPYTLLGKAAIGGAFVLLTLCGIAAPYLGFALTPLNETAAGSIGAIAGVFITLRG